jgi:hypothetical protein
MADYHYGWLFILFYFWSVAKSQLIANFQLLRNSMIKL